MCNIMNTVDIIIISSKASLLKLWSAKVDHFTSALLFTFLMSAGAPTEFELQMVISDLMRSFKAYPVGAYDLEKIIDKSSSHSEFFHLNLIIIEWWLSSRMKNDK